MIGFLFLFCVFLFLEVHFGFTLAVGLTLAIGAMTWLKVPLTSKFAVSVGGTIIPAGILGYLLISTGAYIFQINSWLWFVLGIIFLFLITMRIKTEGIIVPVVIIAALAAVLAVVTRLHPITVAFLVFIGLAIPDLLVGLLLASDSEDKKFLTMGGAGLEDALIVIPALAYFLSNFLARTTPPLIP